MTAIEVKHLNSRKELASMLRVLRKDEILKYELRRELVLEYCHDNQGNSFCVSVEEDSFPLKDMKDAVHKAQLYGYHTSVLFWKLDEDKDDYGGMHKRLWLCKQQPEQDHQYFNRINKLYMEYIESNKKLLLLEEVKRILGVDINQYQLQSVIDLVKQNQE